MKTEVINFKTKKEVKSRAKKIAKNMGLSLSDVLNIYLRQFINKREIHIKEILDESNPSDQLINDVNESEKEYKKGDTKKFNNVEKAKNYLENL